PGFMPMPADRNWNAASGWEYGGQELEREQARQHLLQQMLLDNQRQELANNRYLQVTPHAVRKEDLANQTTEAALPGVRADSRTRGFQADMLGRTWENTANAQNAQNAVSQLEHALRGLELTAGASPMYADSQYQQLRSTWPKVLQDLMPSHYEPGLVDRARN